MEFPVQHPRFQQQRLAVRKAGVFSGEKVVLNGQVIERRQGVYTVTDDTGAAVPVKLKQRFYDPIPNVLIDQEVVRLVEPLKPIEYVWGWAPIALMVLGGAIGGAIGGGVGYVNACVFRSTMGTAQKFLVTALLSCLAVVLYLVAAIAFQMMLRQ